MNIFFYRTDSETTSKKSAVPFRQYTGAQMFQKGINTCTQYCHNFNFTENTLNKRVESIIRFAVQTPLNQFSIHAEN